MSIAPGPSNHWTQQRQSAYQQDQLGSQEACQHDAAHANQLLEMRRHLVSLHADSAAHHAQPPTNEPTPENQSQTMTLKYSYPDASASPSTDPYAPANQASVTSDLETSSAHTIGQREDERSSDVSEPPPEALRLIVDMRDMRNEIEGIAYDVAGLREEVRKVLGLVGGVAGE
ncbi:hypothetical protein CC86DRAFT_411304 [Ophiobolus disseminans]|uniref:Uncharacterized protein n=1 Tax=Ophiobolus disseminans TaxID=1469910 RepID=A0A6A6ZL85_9PLEO|nr:hypothetical protein CC86DRAFT_411304 [Ophiobolus disseminans]